MHLAGNSIGALGTLLVTGESLGCERANLSADLIAKNVETMVANVESGSEDRAASYGLTVLDGETSPIDNRTLQMSSLKLPLVDSEAIAGSVSCEGLDAKMDNLLVDGKVIIERVQAMAASEDRTLEDQAARDDYGVVDGDASSADDKNLLIRRLKLPVVDSVTASDSAIHEELDTREDNMVAEVVVEQESHAEHSQIPAMGDPTWFPCWDSFYGCYYFYNAETQESTWEPPKGFESYLSCYSAQGNKREDSTKSTSKDHVDKNEEVSLEDDFRTTNLPHRFIGTEIMQRSSNDYGVSVSITEDIDATKLTTKSVPLLVEDFLTRSSMDDGVSGSVTEGGNGLTILNDVTLCVKDALSRRTVVENEVSPPSNCSCAQGGESGGVPCSVHCPQMLMMFDGAEVNKMDSSLQERPHRDQNSSSLQNVKWLVSWDAYYGRYYFYNMETSESTWGPPKGSEAYADNEYNIIPSGMPNSETSFSKDSKAELTLEESSKASTLQVKETVFISRDSENQRVSGGKENEEQHVVSLGNLICDEVTTGMLDDSGSHVDVTDCRVAVLKRRAKKAAQCSLRLANQHMDAAAISPTISKYWFQRFHLFSKYELGVKLDEEGWFSVTPEAIAKHQAARCCKDSVIVDAFTGVGGNAIQFALAGHYVVAIDNDPKRIEYAHHNAQVYGVADCIDFVLGDFFVVSSLMQADVVFLSPPWGGPDYLDAAVYDVLTMLQPKDGLTLLNVAHSVAPNIILFLPRNVDMNQLSALQKRLPVPCSCEVERNFLNGKLKAVTAYFGQFLSIVES